MLKNFFLFLDKIRNSEDRIKKRWVFGLSALTMILVVAIWLSYLTFIIKPVGETKTGDEGSSFWPVMKNGFIIIFESAKKRLQDLASKISDERSVTIDK